VKADPQNVIAGQELYSSCLLKGRDFKLKGHGKIISLMYLYALDQVYLGIKIKFQ
jgi:hypothetical protein